MLQDELVYVFVYRTWRVVSADAFLDWARRKLDQMTPDGHPRDLSRQTFAQFFETTGKELRWSYDTTNAYWYSTIILRRICLWSGAHVHEICPYYGRKSSDLNGGGISAGRWPPIVDGGLSNFPMELYLHGSLRHIHDGTKDRLKHPRLLIDEQYPSPASPERRPIPPVEAWSTCHR